MKKILVLTIVLCTVWTSAAWAQQDAWEQMNSMDMKKAGSGSCVIDSMIYVLGGWDEFITTLNDAKAYNTKTDSWSNLAPVPIDLSVTSAGVINNKIYIAGGWRDERSNWSTIDSTFVYDPISDTWETKKECPKKSGDHASCVLNDKLYLLGGLKDFPSNDTSGQKDALVYDPASDTWDSLPEMLHLRGNGARASVYDGKIYVFGGMASLSGTESFIVGKPERYDPGENTWTELADMPVPVLGHMSLVYEDKIYVFGGDSSITLSPSLEESYCTNIIQEYDPLTDEWQLMHPMPFNRTGMIGQKVGNYAYLFGGYPFNSRDFPSLLAEVWRFNLDINWPLGIENSKPDLFKVYPNPAKDQLTIELSEDKKIHKLEILSIDGKMARIIANIHQNSITLKRDNLPSGLYFLRIHSDVICTEKILIE
jgi:N-acetylneuraminic acid mutarotase